MTDNYNNSVKFNNPDNLGNLGNPDNLGNLGNPDKKIEEFWILYKQSMINYYTNQKCISRPIKEWSEKLNYYQSKKNYTEIEKHILNYISLYAIDLMRDNNGYHMNILITNIKRWKRLSKSYNTIIKENSYYNIIFLLIDIYKSIMNEKLNDNLVIIFSQVELIILYNDFSELVKFAVENSKPSMLTKISKYCNIDSILYEYYNITNKDKISYRRLLLNKKN